MIKPFELRLYVDAYADIDTDTAASAPFFMLLIDGCIVLVILDDGDCLVADGAIGFTVAAVLVVVAADVGVVADVMVLNFNVSDAVR